MTEQAATPPATAKPEKIAGRPGWMTALEKPVSTFGELFIFIAQSIAAIPRPPYRFAIFLAQLEFMSYGSLFVVGLTGLFTGMVLALQLTSAFGLFNAQSLVGATLELALARELAPIFTCIVIVARVGSAIATELGTMRVTEQIDALETMAVDPLNYLVVPRVIAAAIAAPILTMLFNAVAITGAYMIDVYVQDISPAAFLNRMQTMVFLGDITNGLGKSMVIGFFVTCVACFRGYKADGGARGVGIATTDAVVSGLISIFAIDYVYTAISMTTGGGATGL
jgi:phospholipid/cholesterol/gamma-HCH transport system permease protein